MKFSTIGLGIALVVGSLFFLKPKWANYQVERNGQLVKMEIIKLPNYCGLTKRKYYMDVIYQGIIFNKKIPVGFCDNHKVGESIEMKYLDEQESILFPNETTRGDFIAIGVFFAIGIFSIIYGIFSKSKNIYRR